MVDRRTVLVTGAYGYLGSRIRSRLEADGWVTTALVRRPQPGDRALRWSLAQPLPPDVSAGTAALVHCAYDFQASRPDDLWRINVQGTATLLQEAAALGISRLLVLSSMSAYPGTRQQYGRIKLEIEKATLAAGGIAIRPGLVYSPDPGGMAASLTRLASLPVVPIVSGRPRQYPVHEDDLVRVVADILACPTWLPEVFGVAQPEPVALKELMTALASARGQRPRYIPLPSHAVYWALKAAERAGLRLGFRSDSLLGLMRSAPGVPRSHAFPNMLDSLRRLDAAALAPDDANGH